MDRDEDGARANYAEEGLVAILSKLSERRRGFLGENTLDGVVIEITKAATMDLEVSVMPGWVWRLAIWQGFHAMHELKSNSGGFLIADLDRRSLTYSKLRPQIAERRASSAR